MTSNNPQQNFWDSFQPYPHQGRGAGQGVDHTFGPNPQFAHGFPFDPSQFAAWAGNGQWGPWGGAFGRPWGHDGRGHQHRPSADAEEQHPDENSSDTMRATPDGSDDASEEDAHPPRGSAHPPPPPPPPPPPAGAHPPPPPPPPPPHAHHPPPFGHPHHPFGFGPGPHRGRGGRGGRCERGRGGHRGRPGPPPPPYAGSFDFRQMMQAFANHPFAQAVRDYVDQAATGTSNDQNETQEDKFVPPVDIFSTEKAYVIHCALPGASKEDVGVHWDSEKSSLTVAGVVYRPGNEELLQSLLSSERKVGMFERIIELPPAGSDKKEEVDGFGITAKMDNGILVITVPKVEKDSWTEIHKIDVD